MHSLSQPVSVSVTYSAGLYRLVYDNEDTLGHPMQQRRQKKIMMCLSKNDLFVQLPFQKCRGNQLPLVLEI